MYLKWIEKKTCHVFEGADVFALGVTCLNCSIFRTTDQQVLLCTISQRSNSLAVVETEQKGQ